MNWACELTDDAKQDLHDLPSAVQKRVPRMLDQMQGDPFQGDVKALRGDEWRACSGDARGITAFFLSRTGDNTSCTSSASSSARARLTDNQVARTSVFEVRGPKACLIGCARYEWIAGKEPRTSKTEVRATHSLGC